MAPGLHVGTASHPLSPTPATLGLGHWRRVSGGIPDYDSFSNDAPRSVASRRVSRKTIAANESSTISNVVYSLKRRSGDELGATTSSQLLNATHATLLDWIRHQRMSKLPPEGSSYDKVLAWAQLFIERLHTFDLAIEHFVGDSYLAAQLAYGYCAILLELGEENASALKISFGFFYSTSMVLANLLERAELFTVSQEIKEQLILALADLVTLVASVATHFHKALRSISKASISVNIYGTFSGQIESFRSRCDKIAEAMWRHQLVRDDLDGNRVSEIKTIKHWLAPDDHVLANVAETTSHLAQDREELTCLWIGPYLSRFLKSTQYKQLSIAGKPGSGKTVLASVIVDHLQHPIGGVSYQTIFVPINGRVPAGTSPRAIVKAILRQLLDKRIGNTHLFQVLSEAYEQSRRTVTDEEYDNILWGVLESALGSALRGAKPLVLVVDGIDEATNGEAQLLQKLHESTAKAAQLKLIVLGSQAAPTQPSQANLSVTPDLIHDDIAAVVRHCFEHHKAFNTLTEVEQEVLIDRVTEASNGSFLWAKLAAKQFRQEETTEALHKSVDTLLSAKLAISDLVARSIQATDLTEPAKWILAWLVTAERPLSQQELSVLLSVQVDKATTTAQNIDVLHLLRPVNSLVFLQDGYIYLRHSQIRTAIVDACSKGKLVPHLKDPHADLVRRLLAYIRLTITEDREPSMTSLDSFEANDIVRKHVLLDFAVRYWAVHLHKTAIFKTEGEKAAAKEFKKVFPDKTTFSLLQWTLWENKDVPQLLSWFTTVVNLSRDILTPHHLATLQTTITLAQFYRQTGLISETAQALYEALTISRKVLNEHHVITIQVASVFLEVTSNSITNSKTEIMTRREEVLLLLVESYKSHYGATSEIVISTLTQLAEHYQFIKEEHKAREIYLSLRTSTIQQYGADSREVREINANLNVHLKGGRTTKVEDNELDVGLLRLDVTEVDEVKTTVNLDFVDLLNRAGIYIAEGNVVLAERIFVEVWQYAARECRMHYSSEWEEKKIMAVLAYTKFLKTQKRDYEVSSLLTTTWQEYEQVSNFASESTVSQLIEVAEVMKTVGLSAVAISVFKRCSQYYESTNKVTSKTYKSIQQSIQSTSREVMQIVSSSSSSSSTYTSETILEEMVYEASTSISTIDETSITTLSTLYSRYASQHRWQDATRLIKRVLQGIWGTLFAASLQDVTLPSKHVDHCIGLAEKLSQCYHSRRRLAKEEDILVRIYRAVRTGRKVGDKLLDRVTTELIKFFERTSQTEKNIHLRQELLSDYIKHYGPHHQVVVANLWVLAELTRPRPIFVDYYRQIISAINKDSEVSKQDAFEPLVIVATELWSQGRYADAVQYYKIIFNTFLQQPKVSAQFEQPEFVKTFFSRYIHCLRTLQSEFSVIHKITVEYHSKVKEVFGATASITVTATLTLAKLCQESKRYEIEAIHLYEELLKVKSEEIDYQDITATLDSIYEEQAAIVTSTETKSVSSSQVERAVSVLKRRIVSVRQTHGWAHEESLSRMQEMVSFYSKREQTESVVQELKEATVQILSTETSSTRLVAAATAIASSYIASKQTEKATELSQEIYRQIIIKDRTNTKTVQFDLTSKERQSLVFLAQLEYSLRQNSSVTLNEIFSALTTEYVYFEDFRSLTKESKNVTLYSVTAAAARLHTFLVSRERHSIAARVFKEFTDYFVAIEAKRTKVTEPAQVHIFALTLLEYFSIHESQDFVRSVGIACDQRVQRLIAEKNYTEACNLALAGFNYISTHESYRTAAIVKFAFQLGLTISGRELRTIDSAIRKKLLSVSLTIVQDVLGVLRDLKINIAQISLRHLNTLIGVLGEQQDYKTLVWLLTLLWNSREAQRSWQPSITFALGRRLIIARYLVGDTSAAVRLAEDTVYNCRRVHGHRHKITLDMSILLSQLYSSVAQRYQAQKGGKDMAHRYYKKAAAVHENILRAFTDPTYAEFDGGDMSMCLDESASSIDLAAAAASAQSALSEGEHVRQHFQLFKLAIERFGDWPKDYSEYERLNADVFREFKDDLQGVEGVEKWNPKSFGSGKAENNADLLDPNFNNWDILETTQASNGVEEEEEL